MAKTYYLKDPRKILDVLENGASLIGTDEEKSEFSYRGRNFVVPTSYLKRLTHGLQSYEDRTIGSLTALSIGNLSSGNRDEDSDYSEIRAA